MLNWERKYWVLLTSAFIFLTLAMNGQVTTSINDSSVYTFLNTKSDLCLDVQRGSKKSGASIVQWEYNAYQHNHWRFKKIDSTTFRIQSIHSNLYLTAYGTQPGRNVIQQAYRNNGYQLWKLIWVDSATFYIKNKGNKLCLDVIEGSDKSNAPIIQDRYVNAKSQLWKIHQIKPIQLAYEGVDGFGKKQNLGKHVNSSFHDVMPIISPNGKILMFCRKGQPLENGRGKDDIFYSRLSKTGEWGPAKPMQSPYNNKYHNSVYSISPDGNMMIISKIYLPNGKCRKGYSYIKKTNTGWSKPVPIRIRNYKTESRMNSLFLAPDMKTLLLSIKNEKSLGNNDLFVSFRQPDSTFSTPKHLGNVLNSPLPEYSPFLSADRKTLYFSSNAHGTHGRCDIFISKRLDSSWTNWSEPLNLGPQINTGDSEVYFNLSAVGNEAYLVSDAEGEGKNDIFKIQIPSKLLPQPLLKISGTVYNSVTKKPIQAKLTYYNLQTKEETGIVYSNPTSGDYECFLPQGNDYYFIGEREGYFSVSEVVQQNTSSSLIEVTQDIYLTPVQLNQTISLNNILFQYDEASLDKGINNGIDLEIERIVTWMTKNPNAVIRIEAHTDNQGGSDYNLALSLKRAKTIKELLINKGISTTRLRVKGYGESKPKISNETKKGRLINRRVELRIQSL